MLRARPATRVRLGPPFDGSVVVGHSTPVRANGSEAPVALSPAAALRTLHQIDRRRIDVAHIHEPFAPVIGYACLARSRVPMVGTFHRSGDSWWYSAMRPLAGWAAGRLDVCCAVSEAARETAAAAVGGPVEVLFNGIDVPRSQDAAPVASNRPTVLFLGRHETRKGLAVLLEAWRRPDRCRALGGR